MEYANMMTLDIIANQQFIPLPKYTLRALMKQILEGMRAFHSSGLIHSDVKCNNILLHSPPGSGRVHVKISDFGLSKKENAISEKIYVAGTLPYMAKELFQEQIIYSQKVDSYAIGVVFFRLVFRKYFLPCKKYKEYKQYFNSSQFDNDPIKEPPQSIDNILWDLLSQMLEFDVNKRITANQALQHPFFTSQEAIGDISTDQIKLAQSAIVADFEGDDSISEFDKDPSFVVAESKLIISSLIKSSIVIICSNQRIIIARERFA
ncbi:MAG: hypothetical protein EZS28_015474 [Streblomastix strix]|uniref:Protein kinase domain-containing protein n=1 Tax=Streblomastix strix TaxID=222440 RepID=A0A5J4W263_9EUKA|nr:MAG: hypothetical protein EZS28_015474 [Streblomastix strix]